MKVIMTAFARQQIRETARYINREFGRKSRDKFLQSVNETKQLLATNPCLGPIEPNLADVPSAYRSVVVSRLNKMVYRILDDHIVIDDFWDCRQAPETLADRVG